MSDSRTEERVMRRGERGRLKNPAQKWDKAMVVLRNLNDEARYRLLR